MPSDSTATPNERKPSAGLRDVTIGIGSKEVDVQELLKSARKISFRLMFDPWNGDASPASCVVELARFG
jgi:hypothetical protein